MTIVRFASVAGLAVAGTALAGPTSPGQQNPVSATQRVQIPVSPEGVQAFCETFESCPGPGLFGCNGWEPWYGAAPDGTVVAGPPGSLSGGKALRYTSAMNDDVHFMNFTSGRFYASCMTFFPTGGVGDGYIILCNQYVNTGPPTVWAAQVKFAGGTLTVSNDAGGFALAPTRPLVTGSWARWEGSIDLTNNRFFDVYAGAELTYDFPAGSGTPMPWVPNGISTPGSPMEIAVVDLYSAGVDGMFTDDFIVTCYADLDQSTGCGTVDIFDFLEFQNKYSASNPIACNADISTGRGVCDIFDFLEFQNLFALGNCP